MLELVPLKMAIAFALVAGIVGYAIASLKNAWQQANDWKAILEFNNKAHVERRDSDVF